MQSRDKNRLIIKFLFQRLCKLQSWVEVQGVLLENTHPMSNSECRIFAAHVAGFLITKGRMNNTTLSHMVKLTALPPEYLFFLFSF